MKKAQQRAWFAWASVGVLAALCGVLALLQNYWISEVSRAERERLQQQLDAELNRLSRDFNMELASACAALLPDARFENPSELNQAYSSRFVQWKETHDAAMFSRIAIATPHNGSVSLAIIEPETGSVVAADWPAEWESKRRQYLNFLRSFPMPPEPAPEPPRPSTLIDIPRFPLPQPRDPRGPGRGHGRPAVPQDWLLLELSIDYVRNTMLPELIKRHLTAGGKVEYDVEVLDNIESSRAVFTTTSAQNVFSHPDASAPLFNISGMQFQRFRHGRPGFGPHGEGAGFPGPHMPYGPRNGPPPGPPGQPGPEGRGPEPGRWRILVRHHAGSLEAVVARARWQNLVTSLGLLALILATVALLVRYSRRAQHLAELQMNFIAGVSHELRTPLTVIRTAAFNLRGQIAARADQVERYGKLIQEESEKLGALVEQVLRFASVNAGHAIRAREPASIEKLIDQGLQASGAALPSSNAVVQRYLEPGLPLVLADELALKFALQNLFDNALKYGAEGGNWIGVYASREASGGVEIRIADHGPGIPADEVEHVFDPFFRGRRAIEEQVHGTGLGLSLVKKIIEAHDGSIHVNSESGRGAEFVVSLPAAPPASHEQQHEIAHSVG